MIYILKKTALYAIPAVFLIVLDRLLKVLALNGYFNYIRLAGDFFHLNLARNPYIAFSLPLTGPFLSVLVFTIIVFLAYYCLLSFKEKRFNRAFFVILIILGASSNLFDRLVYGYVIDYFDLKYFTIFNLADMMITGGVILFLWDGFLSKQDIAR